MRVESAPVSASGLTSPQIEALRGFFFLLVVVGHNTLFTLNILWLFPALYAFHIFAFLFLPFLFQASRPTRRFVADRTVRYLVPHTIFFLVAASVYTVVFQRHEPAAKVAGEVALGWLISSAAAYKEACGLYIFWFLPTLWTLVMLRSLYAQLPAAARRAILVALLVAHGWIGGLGEAAKYWLPFGLPIVAYVLPLALAVEVAWRRWCLPRLRLAAALGLAVFAVCLAWRTWLDCYVSIAALAVYTWHEPGRLLLSDVTACAAFLGFAAASAWLERVPGLRALGRFSLFVYLLHSMVYQALLRALPWIERRSSGEQIVMGFVLLAVTLAISLAAAAWVDARPAVRRWLLPRTAAEWPPSAALVRRAEAVGTDRARRNAAGSESR